MSMAMLGLGLAAAAGPEPMARVDYRLPPPTAAPDRCRPTGDEDEIVVCGRRNQERFRLRGLAPPRGMDLTRPSPFEWDLGNGARGGIDVDQFIRPDGFVDYRLLFTLRIPF